MPAEALSAGEVAALEAFAHLARRKRLRISIEEVEGGRRVVLQKGKGRKAGRERKRTGKKVFSLLEKCLCLCM